MLRQHFLSPPTPKPQQLQAGQGGGEVRGHAQVQGEDPHPGHRLRIQLHQLLHGTAPTVKYTIEQIYLAFGGVGHTGPVGGASVWLLL